MVDEHFKKSLSTRSTNSLSTSRTKASKQASSSKLSTADKDTTYSWSTNNWTTTPYPGQSHAHYQPYSHSTPMQQTLAYDSNGGNSNSWGRPYNQAYTDYNKMYPSQPQYTSMGFIDHSSSGHNIDQATSNIKDESIRIYIDMTRL